MSQIPFSFKKEIDACMTSKNAIFFFLNFRYHVNVQRKKMLGHISNSQNLKRYILKMERPILQIFGSKKCKFAYINYLKVELMCLG